MRHGTHKVLQCLLAPSIRSTADAIRTDEQFFVRQDLGLEGLVIWPEPMGVHETRVGQLAHICMPAHLTSRMKVACAEENSHCHEASDGRSNLPLGVEIPPRVAGRQEVRVSSEVVDV